MEQQRTNIENTKVLDGEGNVISHKDWTFFKHLLAFSIENLMCASEVLKEVEHTNKDELLRYSGVLELTAKRVHRILNSVSLLTATEKEIKDYLKHYE